MTRVYLVRHTRTIWSSRRFCGRTDLHLSAAGVAQAAQLARRFGPSLSHGTSVWSSPARRAVQTARPIALALGGSIELDVRLREVDFGQAEGLTFDQVQRRWPQLAARLLEGPSVVDWPGGESVASVLDRVKDLARGLERHDGDVIVITHGGVLRALLAALRVVEQGVDSLEPGFVIGLERRERWEVVERLIVAAPVACEATTNPVAVHEGVRRGHEIVEALGRDVAREIATRDREVRRVVR